ncbi:hypothetical protein FNF28_07090 [Cafeteria roenbergensis]|uniref:alpha-1,2-Mannosidase n=1 Tax=Cafeteria roenbergensis TaxID=33653 RepID=A0A5A8CFY7_CAFRO|nr:hypothetical protein FNF28_07090 [Cafeteria roenbergensis]
MWALMLVSLGTRLSLEGRLPGFADASSSSNARVPPIATTRLSVGELWEYRERAREMWYHAWDSYHEHAWPHDELRPLSCRPRKWNERERGTLDDSLGGFALTAVDGLQSLALLGDAAGFERHGRHICETVRVDRDVSVSVFEATIRVLGGLVTSHAIAEEGEAAAELLAAEAEGRPPAPWAVGALASVPRLWPGYDGCLLRLAADLGHRLAPAYTDAELSDSRLPSRLAAAELRALQQARARASGNASAAALQPLPGPVTPAIAAHSGAPLPRHLVNLARGTTPRLRAEASTCSAAAGTALLEAVLLSAFTGNQSLAILAARSTAALFAARAPGTGLVGSSVDVLSAQWTAHFTGIGASVDSFYEYAAKAAVLLDSPALTAGWEGVAQSVAAHLSLELDHVDPAVPPAFFSGRSEPPQPQSSLRRGAHTHAATYAALSDRRARNATIDWGTVPAPPASWAAGAEVHMEASVAAGRVQVKPLAVSSLQAFWPATLVLAGRVAEARAVFRPLAAVWRVHGALPEAWDVLAGRAVGFAKDSPLRPELAESAYALAVATGDGVYAAHAASMLDAIEDRHRVKCGYAALADVAESHLDDRMDSFFLSETASYLFLTFDSQLRRRAVDASGPDEARQALMLAGRDRTGRGRLGSLFSGARGGPAAGSALEGRTLFTTEGHAILLTSRLRRAVAELQAAVAVDAGERVDVAGLAATLLEGGSAAPPGQDGQPGGADRCEAAEALQAPRAKSLAQSAFGQECPAWAEWHRVPPLHLEGLSAAEQDESEARVRGSHAVADAVWAYASPSAVNSVLRAGISRHSAAVSAGQPFLSASPVGMVQESSAGMRAFVAINSAVKADASSEAGQTAGSAFARALEAVVGKAVADKALGVKPPQEPLMVPVMTLWAQRDLKGRFQASLHPARPEDATGLSITRPEPDPNAGSVSSPVSPEALQDALNGADLPGLDTAAISCGPVSGRPQHEHVCQIRAHTGTGFLLRLALPASGSPPGGGAVPAPVVISASGAAFGPMLSPAGLAGPIGLADPAHGCESDGAAPAVTIEPCFRGGARCELSASGEAVCSTAKPIAVAIRGGCTFASKARAAQAAGAGALIVLDPGLPADPEALEAESNPPSDEQAAATFLMAAEAQAQGSAAELDQVMIPAALVRGKSASELAAFLQISGERCGQSGPCSMAQLATQASEWASPASKDRSGGAGKLSCRSDTAAVRPRDTHVRLWRDPLFLVGGEAGDGTVFGGPGLSDNGTALKDMEAVGFPLASFSWDGKGPLSERPARVVSAVFHHLLQEAGKVTTMG